ncbi:hypothetical protein [Thalassobacillus hwangdonensis]|uniref:Uncharacterized protein n=1 Tax=Thalassobacillus hwangdonensis TaxID=546108 RepID=A0ABW3KZ32_9BACI
MSRAKKLMTTGIILVIVTIFLIYWFYLAEPGPFLKEQEVLNQVNETFAEADAETIQDIRFVEDGYVFAPHISGAGDYGYSLWEWKHNKWKLVRIDTIGEPMIWKLDPSDPSTYHIIWNFHPDDQAASMKMYALRRRGYHISMGVENYSPAIQMSTDVTFDATYGTRPVPKQWSHLMKATAESQADQHSIFSFGSMFQNPTFQLRYTLYKQDGTVTFPKHSVNGHGYSMGSDTLLDYMPSIEESELDRLY